MLGLCAAATLAAAVPFLWILAYVIQQGAARPLARLLHQPADAGRRSRWRDRQRDRGLGHHRRAWAPGGRSAGHPRRHLHGRPPRYTAGARRSASPPTRSPACRRSSWASSPTRIVVLPQGHFSALCRRGGPRDSSCCRSSSARPRRCSSWSRPRCARARWLSAPQTGGPRCRVVLPAAAGGILTGIMLAVARAAGEAAPMLFTAFGNPFMSTDINQPIATLPAHGLHLRHLAVPGLAIEGLGDGARPDRPRPAPERARSSRHGLAGAQNWHVVVTRRIGCQ